MIASHAGGEREWVSLVAVIPMSPVMSERVFLFATKVTVVLLNVIVAACAKVSGREEATQG